MSVQFNSYRIEKFNLVFILKIKGQLAHGRMLETYK
jgi:hypothetical protein